MLSKCLIAIGILFLLGGCKTRPLSGGVGIRILTPAEITVACDSTCMKARRGWEIYTDQERIHARKQITFELYNHSADDLYFAVNKDFFGYMIPNPDEVRISEETFGYVNHMFFAVHDDKGKRPGFWVTTYRQSDPVKIQEEDDWWAGRRDADIRTMVEDGFVLRSGESRTMSVSTLLPIVSEADGNNSTVSFFVLHPQKKYNLALYYFAREKIMKKYVPKHIADSLHRNGVKFFDGTLKSDDIPLRVVEGG